MSGEHMEIRTGSIEHAVQQSLESKRQGIGQGHIYEIKHMDGSVRYEFLTKEEADTLKAAGDFLRKVATITEGKDKTELTLKISKHVGSDDRHTTEIAEKIFTSFKAIKEVQIGAIKEEAEKISDASVLKICAKAQTILGRGGEGILRVEKDLEHPVHVDFSRKEFTILLGGAAKIQAEGVAGRVESVIRVASGGLGTSQPETGHFVHKTAKSGYEIDEEELRLTKKYQNAHEFTYDNEKVLVVKAFDGNLFSKIETTGEASPESTFGSVTDYKQNLHIISQLTEQLATMHNDGDTHLDLKPDNILVRSDSAGNYTAQIADFGMSNKDLAIYGTFGYTAPETVERFVNLCLSAKADSADDSEIVSVQDVQAKGGFKPFTAQEKEKQDVYALGLVAYTLAAGSAPEWIDVIESSQKSGGKFDATELEQAIEMQKNVSEAISDEKEYHEPESKKLLDFIGELLEPDPAKRPNIEQCREKINLLIAEQKK